MRFSRTKLAAAVITTACALLAPTGVMAQNLVLVPNMEVLKAEMPSDAATLVSANQQGQLYFPGEPVTLKIKLKKADGPVSVEIQEITTRDPEAKAKGAYTDTAGDASLIGLEGKPVKHDVQVDFGAGAEAEVELANLPVPEKFGTYALVITTGGKRHFLTSVARVPQNRDYGTLENTPVFGEGQFMNGDLDQKCAIYARMGIRGFRAEMGWAPGADGAHSWEAADKLFSTAEKYGLRIMVTVGGMNGSVLPFGVPTPAAGWKLETGGYGGTGDWLCHPDLYPAYEKWLTEFITRYWKDGKGALWGLENYNEPWEGGGISGWARDCVQYREIQKIIARAARSVSPDIRLLAASSIMNTEDKLYSDGSKEFDQYVDIFTDHYVVPKMCYGPMVARSKGKESMETETWFVNSEFLLPQGVAQFMASGQSRISPWHPRVLYDFGSFGAAPSPVTTATAALNYMLAGKTFEKIAFPDHLPWVFQYGKDDDNDALLIVFGQLINIGGDDKKERTWSQVDTSPGGTMTIDNADGLLSFFDMAGNPIDGKEGVVTIPLTIMPTYIKSKSGPKAAVERIAEAKMEGKRPVEIIPHDFDAAVADGAKLNVTLHNCLNRAITGTLTIKAPDGISLKASEASVELAAGERKVVTFDVATAKSAAANAYPFDFNFTSDAGDAAYQEVLNAAIAPRHTIEVDGNLDDWKDVAGVTLVPNSTGIDRTELIRRPWLDITGENPKAGAAEFKVAWDENYLYVSARVNDPSPQKDLVSFADRDENSFFHTAASDKIEPYKTFVEEFNKTHPDAKYKSFADVSFVYCRSPEAYIPFRRDRLQIALDTTEGHHDLKPIPGVPEGFHAEPDTDYEYSLYLTDGGSELWRHLAPGVPRIHDMPRQVRGEKTTGVVPGAKHIVKLDGTVYTYEMAIPKSELAELNLTPGTKFGLMVRAGSSDNAHCDYGIDKAATQSNGLTLHPYWERSSNCGVKWTLVAQ